MTDPEDLLDKMGVKSQTIQNHSVLITSPVQMQLSEVNLRQTFLLEMENSFSQSLQ